MVIIDSFRSMGILKTLLLVTAPAVGLTVLAFRLGSKLPVAARLFGNYIALSYVYFKSLLKMIKPVDQVPFEVISLARKTSQQSQALRRELKSTLKRVQEEVKSKREEAFQSLSQEGVKGEAFGEWLREEEGGTEPRTARAAVSGSELIVQMMVRRQELLLLRGEKQKQSRFYQSL